MNIEKLHNAVFALYPNIIAVHGSDIDSLEAIDKTEKNIVIDKNAVLNWQDPNQYKFDRIKEYPPITDYLDGIVKGDTEQVQAYIDACLAVKAKYPKPE